MMNSILKNAISNDTKIKKSLTQFLAIRNVQDILYLILNLTLRSVGILSNDSVNSDQTHTSKTEGIKISRLFRLRNALPHTGPENFTLMSRM